MLSIFVMYSTDRSQALGYTIHFLEQMYGYSQCQKILVVDGQSDIHPKGWDVVEVPRNKGKFCWGRMWDAGVGVSKYETIIYLDSDRLLPKRLLTCVLDNIAEDTFLYTSPHFQMYEVLPVESCRKFVETNDLSATVQLDEFLAKLKFDPKTGVPHHGSGKNVMSGCTAFTRSTYIKLGGVDHWYCGHGAYADTDFHYQAAVGGCRFVDLQLPELHFPHSKLDDKRDEINKDDLNRLALDNFIYYCNKWCLPLTIAQDLANLIGLRSPAKYINNKVKELRAIARGSC